MEDGELVAVASDTDAACGEGARDPRCSAAPVEHAGDELPGDRHAHAGEPTVDRSPAEPGQMGAEIAAEQAREERILRPGEPAARQGLLIKKAATSPSGSGPDVELK